MQIKQLIERVKLAWRIVRGRDGNLVAHAVNELTALGNYDDEDGPDRWIANNVVDLIRVFSTQGHSGFSAPFCIRIFRDAASFKPLGPLTGADAEWFDHGDSMGPGTRWQNKRCGNVFKGADGQAYDINAVVFEEPNGCRFTGRYSHMPVTFPYTPRTVIAQVPEDATDVQKEMLAQQAWAAA